MFVRLIFDDGHHINKMTTTNSWNFFLNQFFPVLTTMDSLSSSRMSTRIMIKIIMKLLWWHHHIVVAVFTDLTIVDTDNNVIILVLVVIAIIVTIFVIVKKILCFIRILFLLNRNQKSQKSNYHNVYKFIKLVINGCIYCCCYNVKR